MLVEDTKHLRDQTWVWYKQQLHMATARILVLKKDLGYKEKSKTCTTRLKKVWKENKDLEKMERNKRQPDCWGAVQDILNELNPSENIHKMCKVLYLGPLINTIQYLDSINKTQTGLADIQAKTGYSSDQPVARGP